MAPPLQKRINGDVLKGVITDQQKQKVGWLAHPAALGSTPQIGQMAEKYLLKNQRNTHWRIREIHVR